MHLKDVCWEYPLWHLSLMQSEALASTRQIEFLVGLTAGFNLMDFKFRKLLSDTEFTKDIIQQIIGGDLTCDFTKVI